MCLGVDSSFIFYTLVVNSFVSDFLFYSYIMYHTHEYVYVCMHACILIIL